MYPCVSHQRILELVCQKVAGSNGVVFSKVAKKAKSINKRLDVP